MNAPRRALVVIDAQQEYFEGLLQIQYPARDESLTRITQAMDAAEQAGVPVIIFQHEAPEGFPVFATGSATFELHPDIAARASKAAKRFTKQHASIFADTDLESWLREQGIDTITLTGYMTNNCVLGSAVGAEPLGFNVEVLSDATGAIDIANEAGSGSARVVHETLMTLLHSNWAAVTTTDAWIKAAKSGEGFAPNNLIVSAAQGRTQSA